MLTARIHATVLALAATALFLHGCLEQPEPHLEPRNGSQHFADLGEPTSQLFGHVWDPEIMWYLLAMCDGEPEPCPADPAAFPGVPAHELSILRGAQVVVIDPMDEDVAYPAEETTGDDGEWFVSNVPFREDVPFFALAEVPPAGLRPPPEGYEGFPMPAPAQYLPTLDLKPIATNYTMCMQQQTSILGHNGILEAVAKYLTEEGTPTTVNDLLDKERFAGVVVWWLLQPVPPGIHVPAFGTQVKASAGEVLNIDWAPPGVLPEEIQSERGFFVNMEEDFSPMGITVTLVRPVDGNKEITWTPIDPVEDPEQGRPWYFGELPPMTVSPGIIMFGELPAYAESLPIPPWACLPE